MSISAGKYDTEKDLSRPRYVELQDLIRKEIQESRLKENEAIQTEREIADRYQVSRVTVRRAIEGLVNEGLLTRRRGSGTFIAAKSIKVNFRSACVSDGSSVTGCPSSGTWLKKTTGAMTFEESSSLHLPEDTPVCRFVRLQFADGLPVALVYSTIPQQFLPFDSVIEGSIYSSLALAGNRPTRAVERVRAVNLSLEFSEYLSVDPGRAGLCIERRGYVGNIAVELTKSYYRGDVFECFVEMTTI